jgi:hypothetical protein
VGERFAIFAVCLPELVPSINKPNFVQFDNQLLVLRVRVEPVSASQADLKVLDDVLLV